MVQRKRQVVVSLQPKKAKSKNGSRQPRAATNVTAVGKALRALGGLGGTYAGGLLGNPALGGAAGTGFGAMVSKWLGQGDYTVSSNSLISSIRPDGTVPSMHKEGQSIIVRHKEFLGELTGSTAFAVKKRFNINPGDPGTFPWLAAIASQYTEYKVRGMVFHYVPTSGTAVNSTNPALGSVMIQTSYRANEAPPATKLEMMNEYWATEARPSDPFCHPIECDPKENPFNVQYVRTVSVPSTENVLMYDLGVTTVATTGCPAAGNVIGDLWCTYEIELKKPKLAAINTETAATATSYAQGALSNTAPLGVSTFTSIPGVTFTNEGIYFPPETSGNYLVSWTAYNLSATPTTPALAFVGGANSIFGAYVSVAGSSSLSVSTVVRITPGSSSTAVRASVASWAGSNIISCLRITEYNSNATF